jgi:hypothetical protein
MGGPSSPVRLTRAVARDSGSPVQIAQSMGAAGASRFVSFCSPRGVSIIALRPQYLAFDRTIHTVLTLSNRTRTSFQEVLLVQHGAQASGIPLPPNVRVTTSYRPPR